MEVIFFDVGQGDAALIKSPQGHTILIDGGPGEVVLEKLGKEIPFFNRSIDLVILTHPHYDHLSGVVEVLLYYNVKEVVYTGVREENTLFKRWEEVVSEKGYRTARSGMRISANDFYIDILYPFDNLDGEIVKDSNSTSVISRLAFRDHGIIFTGDAYSLQEKEVVEMERRCEEEDSLVCRSITLSSDVLKVGHHGSRTSTSQEFVVAVSPSVAVISAGKNNRYGHPHTEVLETLDRYGVSVMRTDRDGDVRMILE